MKFPSAPMNFERSLITHNSKSTVFPLPVGAEITMFTSDWKHVEKHSLCSELKYLHVHHIRYNGVYYSVEQDQEKLLDVIFSLEDVSMKEKLLKFFTPQGPFQMSLIVLKVAKSIYLVKLQNGVEKEKLTIVCHLSRVITHVDIESLES